MKIVTTTVDTLFQARKISALVVKRKLVKCAGFWKIEACYTWKGKFVQDTEYMIEMKCVDMKAARRASRLVASHHPYSVPMISIHDGGLANKGYRRWMKEK
ncbi:divalent-cation tolerance protein CutA [Candidatus Parvarchaeota archaeon]|nr:divalent-cation tolerance protein CutA [Candidatus Parvarchaeota archaeon]